MAGSRSKRVRNPYGKRCGNFELVVRLLKALESLAAAGDVPMRGNSLRHTRLALARAEKCAHQYERRATAAENASLEIMAFWLRPVTSDFSVANL